MALLEVGKVIRPHGLNGTVVVDLVTNRLERLAPGSVLTVRAPEATFGLPATLTVRSARPQKNRFLVVFEAIEGHDAAEALRDVVLLAEPVADPDALFVHELIGKVVVDTAGVRRGVVSGVEANPASDLLVIDERDRVPVRFIVTTGDEIVIDVPEGLFS